MRAKRATEASSGGVVRAYIAVTKPRIIELLLVTSIPTMILAAAGLPEWQTALGVLLGGSLAAAGANTFNSVYDADIDALMVRTEDRPVATGVISQRAGMTYAFVLSIASLAVLTVLTNWLAALLAALAIVFYALGYTVILKRRTSQNIVWGGAAGCMPVLIGWAAVTGSLSLTPFVLFLIVFWWTPPHYWPLAIKYRAEYEAASVPMLPVVAPPSNVARQIVIYSWVMVATSLLLIPIAPMGVLYIVVSLAAGLVFLWQAHALSRRLRRGIEPVRAMTLFHYSITYLAVVFLAVAIDPFLPL